MAAVVAVFVVYNAGAFMLYGGRSPGPRFLSPRCRSCSWGFLSRSPAGRSSSPASSWRRRCVSTFVAATWMLTSALRFDRPPDTVWEIVGIPQYGAVAVIFVTAIAAVGVACAVSRPVIEALSARWTPRDG